MLFCFFVRFLFSCHILSGSLRGPATQPLHSEGRRPELGRGIGSLVDKVAEVAWFSGVEGCDQCLIFLYEFSTSVAKVAAFMGWRDELARR